MFVTGYHTLPSIRSYWSESPSLGCPIIKATMARNRFVRIKSFLHVCDNEFIDPKDKFAKVSPLNEMINERFMQFGVFAHEPLKQARRYDRKAKRMCNIEMPYPIQEYNRTMGGVDLFDNAMNSYRIRIRGKKWYWPLFTNALDAAMVNAWKLHCLCRKFGQ